MESQENQLLVAIPEIRNFFFFFVLYVENKIVDLAVKRLFTLFIENYSKLFCLTT